MLAKVAEMLVSLDQPIPSREDTEMEISWSYMVRRTETVSLGGLASDNELKQNDNALEF